MPLVTQMMIFEGNPVGMEANGNQIRNQLEKSGRVGFRTKFIGKSDVGWYRPSGLLSCSNGGEGVVFRQNGRKSGAKAQSRLLSRYYRLVLEK